MQSIDDILNLDWENDEYLVRWLSNRKRSIRYVYTISMNYYTKFLAENYEPLTPEQMLVQRGEEDNLIPWDRGKTKEKVIEFNHWMQKEMGLSSNTARARPNCGKIIRYQVPKVDNWDGMLPCYRCMKMFKVIQLDDFISG
jgi:hypothetical protein